MKTPGPPALPLVGHAPAFLRDKLGFLARCAAEYGDVVQLDIGGRTYLVSGPDDIKHVLVSKSDNYEKTARLTSARRRRFFGDGLVTAMGPAHLRQRRMLQPSFHRSVIARFAGVITAAADEMLDRWEPDAVIDIHERMLDVTRRITLRSLFAIESDAKLEALGSAVSTRRRYQEYLLGSVLPFADRLPTRLRRRHEHADREIDAFIRDAIHHRRSSSVRGDDLLQLLMQATFDDGSHMDDQQIRHEVRSLTVAGFETVAEALTWAWFLLAQFPATESAIISEVSAVSGNRSLDAADLPSLPYCRMVLAEAMRLYPPTWLFVRVAQEDDVLPSGTHIPAGSKIYLSQWVIHRNPRFFPNPETFDPDRFAEDAIRSRPRYSYLPFGAGRRLCIGEEFAWMQGVLLLAAIARRTRLQLVAGQTVVPEPNVTLRPRNGIRMRVLGR